MEGLQAKWPTDRQGNREEMTKSPLDPGPDGRGKEVQVRYGETMEAMSLVKPEAGRPG